MSALFEQKCPAFMKRFMADIGCEAFHAAGAFGNAGRESGGFVYHHEIGKPAGQGGYGWFQWTGPRRQTFLSFCKQKGLQPESDEASYQFLIQELRTTEKTTVSALKATRSLSSATAAFERTYERAGVKALSDRLRWAQRAMAAFNAAYGQTHPIKASPQALASHAAKHPTRHLRRA